jgi:hypothetical protein
VSKSACSIPLAALKLDVRNLNGLSLRSSRSLFNGEKSKQRPCAICCLLNGANGVPTKPRSSLYFLGQHLITYLIGQVHRRPSQTGPAALRPPPRLAVHQASSLLVPHPPSSPIRPARLPPSTTAHPPKGLPRLLSSWAAHPRREGHLLLSTGILHRKGVKATLGDHPLVGIMVLRGVSLGSGRHLRHRDIREDRHLGSNIGGPLLLQGRVRSSHLGNRIQLRSVEG